MIRQLDDKTLVSGQIAPATVAELKQQGVTMIVNNRPDGEDPGQPTGAEIEKAAEAAGIAYRSVPILRGIGPADVEAMEEAIEQRRRQAARFLPLGHALDAGLGGRARRSRARASRSFSEAAARAGVDLAPIAHLL